MNKKLILLKKYNKLAIGKMVKVFILRRVTFGPTPQNSLATETLHPVGIPQVEEARMGEFVL